MGVGLGLLILARNDGIFLAAALLGGALLTSRSRAALRAAVLCGGAIVATILPWLAFNLALAGSLVPQSGAATNAGPSGRVDGVGARRLRGDSLHFPSH